LRRNERIAIGVIVVLAVAISGIAFFDLFYSRNLGNATTSNSFVNQPVVDIIIPSLFKESSTGGINSALNLTRGQVVSLQVEVFPTFNLTASMNLRVYALNTSQGNASGAISATFEPEQLNVAENSVKNTTMTIDVSSNAQPAGYNAVVSATNAVNASQSWGDVFQLNVLP
jgi:hypothetical protein